MEHAIGEIVTLPDGRKAEVVDAHKPSCVECFLHDLNFCYHIKCAGYERTDHKNIIYKEIKNGEQIREVYALDELQGKHKYKPIKKLVRCIHCKFCSIGKLGDLECQKKLHGKTEDNWEEWNLTIKMAIARRYCDGYEYSEI